MEQSIPDFIYVQNCKGEPLMPTRRHNKVWYWLRKGLADIVRREPFTIQLRFDTPVYTQPVTVGVDTGSQAVGIAAVANKKVLLQAEVLLRTDIKGKLDRRRQYRHNRRSRKIRYRAARFANRRCKSRWLPPSLQSKADATIKAVRWVTALLPVHQINVEVGSFDTQKMQNPEIKGITYQQGELFGYLVREYVLSKWKRRCSYCHITGVPLQIEHIIPKSRGGSNRVSNLALACKPCNQKKDNRTAKEFGYPEIQDQARVSLKDAAHVSAIKTTVVTCLREQFGLYQVRVSYGYETKYQRKEVLGLPKSHTNDAIAIACTVGEHVASFPIVYQLRCIPRGQYQLYNGKRSEHRVWASKKVHSWKMYEVVRIQGRFGYISGRRLKGAFLVKDLVTSKKLLEVIPRKLVRVRRPMQGFMVTTISKQIKDEHTTSSG